MQQFLVLFREPHGRKDPHTPEPNVDHGSTGLCGDPRDHDTAGRIISTRTCLIDRDRRHSPGTEQSHRPSIQYSVYTRR